MAIKEKYVGTINIFHKAYQTLTAGEPVKFDANGKVIPATVDVCEGLVAQDVIADDGLLSGSAKVSLDTVTTVGRVDDPVGVYQGGVYLTNMIQDATVAPGDKLYVDTVNRKLTKTLPAGSPVVVAKVELAKDANGFALIRLV